MAALPGYTLRDKLRETAYSSVFRACRDADRISVVLKVLSRDCAKPELVARLKHEHRILKSLQSPYTVRAFGLVESGTTLALILEDLGDRSVDQLVSPGGMEIRAFLEVAIALTRAVEAVHRHYLVHKDVKPHHFLLSGTLGHAKLIDFGIASALPWQLQQSVATQDLEGTLAYLSPEQTGRVDRVLDRRTDLYSLGVTLYELLTGALPFRASDPLELIHSHVACAPLHPRDLRSDVPDVLAAIVLKLLSKVAEERYHTAAGLMADLQACLRAFDMGEKLSELHPGREDISDELCVTRRLYGRHAEIEALSEALDRVRKGATELWLIRGASGVGKSALAHDLQQRVLVNERFVTGKFDHVDRAAPYSAVIHACRSLVRSILGEGAEKLNLWRRRLLGALGPNGQLVSELVPEVESIIGQQPPVQPLAASEAQHRFELVLQNFLRVFALPDHPLVLFLDDLQWADPASLRWLQLCLTAPDRGYLLVLGAYREHEVTANHPLDTVLQELARAGASVVGLDIGPLALADVAQLLTDTLTCPPERAEPLAEVLRAKTGGNPFFVVQLLHELYRAGLVWFDARQRSWTWDLRRIEQVAVTENVADLMITKLGRLPSETLHILRLAACVGHQFDCQTLSVISERPPAEVAAELEATMREGLVLPLDARIHDWVQADASSGSLLAERKVSYRFLHDRVQQGTYETIEPGERGPVHLRIGRLMLARSDGHPADDQLFAVVDHLNRGAAGIDHPEERRLLARLNLRAGRKARDSGAHAAASRLLAMTLELLGPNLWSSDREVAHAAHITKAECEFLSGHAAAAFSLLQVVELQALTLAEQVPARELKITMLTTMNRVPEAVELSLETARLLGAEFPTGLAEVEQESQAEFARLQQALGQQSIESLLVLPAMKDPAKLALVNILFKAGPAIFQLSPKLMVLTVLKVINLALRHGNSPVLPYFYESYGIIHPVLTGDYETAYRFGRLGVDLYAKVAPSPAGGAAHFVFAAFNAHWRRPLTETIEHFRLGFTTSLELGDHIHAGYCLCIAVFHRFYRGEVLAGLLGELPGLTEQLAQTKDVINLRQLSLIGQVWKSLTGRTSAPSSLDSDGFDEQEFLASLQGNRSLHVYYYVHKSIVLYYADDPVGALAAAEQAVPLQPGLFLEVEHCFYRALALAAQCWSTPVEGRGPLIESLQQEEARLGAWSRTGTTDHRSRHALVAAELLALQGVLDGAAGLYDDSLSTARAQGALHLLALGSELCGEFYRRRGRERIAQAYLADAHRGYLDWGAQARANHIMVRYTELLPLASPVISAVGELDVPILLADPRHSGVITNAGRATSASSNEQFELVAALKATQAIAGELKLDLVLDRSLRVFLEHAGAERGCLVLVRDDTLEIEACATLDPDEVRVGLGERVSTSSRLAVSVVQYVARCLETVVVADAATDPLFARDTYVSTARPKSLLCLPLQHRGRLVGVLYLENNAATRTFNRSRLELLELLAAQAAVAVENAKLYEELQASSDLLRRSNEALELQVAERTEQVTRALADLWSEVDLARKIQTVLLPNERQVGSCQVAASMVPASSVGGDYYDVFQCGSSSWLMIGDVSGHGIAAGLGVMMVQTAARAIVQTAAALPEGVTPAQVVARVNAAMSGNLSRVGRGQYMTLTAVEIRGSTARHAGLHMDLLHYRATSHEVLRVPTRGMWVGVVDDIAPLLTDSSFELAEGDVLLLFTDGITEARVGDQRLGTEGLGALLAQLACKASHPESIVKGISRHLAGAGAADDMTVVAVRYAPSSGVAGWEP